MGGGGRNRPSPIPLEWTHVGGRAWPEELQNAQPARPGKNPETSLPQPLRSASASTGSVQIPRMAQPAKYGTSCTPRDMRIPGAPLWTGTNGGLTNISSCIILVSVQVTGEIHLCHWSSREAAIRCSGAGVGSAGSSVRGQAGHPHAQQARPTGGLEIRTTMATFTAVHQPRDMRGHWPVKANRVQCRRQGWVRPGGARCSHRITNNSRRGIA